MKNIILIGGLFLFFIFCAPAAAQEPECDDPPDPDASIPAELLTYCTDHPEFLCDLMISPWDETTYRSPDIRIGDPLNTPEVERPRFFFDSIGNRFYTKLYVKFNNFGVGPACAGAVTVTFSFKESGNPADIDNNSILWQSIGTYTMNILPPATVGAIFAEDWHYHQKGVCWHMTSGTDLTTATQFPMQFIIKAEVNWASDENSTNNIAYSLYDLSAVEHLAHIAFAIDLSGSMNSTIPDIGHKLTVAKQKAMLFANLVEDDNYLGVYSFATGNPNNTDFTKTYIGTDNSPHTETLGETAEISPMLEISGNSDRVNFMIDIAGQGSHGCTPVGQGLLRAKYGLDSIPAPPPGDPAPSKAIVLFSDGLQNVSPFVNNTPPYTCGSYPSYTNIDAEKTFADEDISIYSVYFGPEIGWAYDLMNQIKDQTGGMYVYGAATELELAAAYYAIRGLVDDIVYLKEEGITTPQQPWPMFEVNFDGAARTATVAVAWPLGDGKTRLTIDYRKKGDTEWISPDEMETSPEYLTATAGISQSSFKVFRFMPGANITCEFRVRQITPRIGETRYAAAVFSDVIQAQLRPSLDDVGFEVGDPLRIYADLRAAGHALQKATVNAVVKNPIRSFSSTLRKYSKKFSPGLDPDTNRISTILPQLRKYLKKDVGSDKLYVYKDVLVKLYDNGVSPDKVKGDGVYSGELSGANTHIAGRYEVTFTATGTLPSGKGFERSAKLSTICNVGPVDINKSTVEMSISPPRDDGTRLVTTTIFPTDRFGNAAFPGSGYKINVSTVSAGGTLKGDVVDNFDSSFTQNLMLQPGETAKIKVTVGGVSLGKYSTAKPLLRHEASFHLGLATPEGSFDKVVSSGYSIAFDYTYRFNHNFGIRSELAFNWFDDRSDGTRLLTNFTSYLQYRYRTGRLVPYFESGLGFYSLENSDSALGYSVGVGFQCILSRQWNLDFNLHGHKVGGNLDLSFIQIHAGAIFKF